MPLNAAFNVLVLVPNSDIFVHRATAANSAGDISPSIDNALTNGHPNAILFATPNLNPGGVGGTYNNHNFGVYYDSGQWAVFNQDGVTIPVGAAFNVLVPNPDTSVFVHKATTANILSHSTIIDYPLTNGNPNAILLVTPNLNPGEVGGAYDDHPIGVFYDGSKWRIYNQDGAAMPVGAAFNVFVPTAKPGIGVFVQTATGANSTGANFTIIDNALANGNPMRLSSSRRTTIPVVLVERTITTPSMCFTPAESGRSFTPTLRRYRSVPRSMFTWTLTANFTCRLLCANHKR